MSAVINTIILSIIQVISCTCISKTITKKELKSKNIKNILILMGLVATFYLFMVYDIGTAKPLVIYVILIIGYKYIYKISFNESIITNFISMLLNCISEVIIAVAILMLKIPQNIMEKYLTNTPTSNIISLILILVILKIFKDKLIRLKLIMETEKATYAFYGVMALAITLLIRRNIENNWSFNFDFIVNAIIIIIFVTVIVFLFIEKYKIHKKNEEFNNMYEQVESVKTLLQRYRKYNHENKNQLIVIRENSKENKKVTEYIDSILEENKGHEDKWISELSYITDSGISGFLSVKINQMVDDNMNVSLTISPKVKEFSFENITSNEYKDICRVLGVYLDNAYEASKDTEKKEITIEILLDGSKLLIIISNSFNGKIELDKIDKEGYTTKGKEHGIGLSLVKDIINSKKKFEQKREIIKDYFYQYFYIDNY